MKKIVFLIIFLSISTVNAFSLKDKIINGKNGDYVVTEQGGMTSVLLIRSLTTSHLILEEIDIPSLSRPSNDDNWKAWICHDAPGHTAWISYLIDLKENKLQECYSHSQGVWLPTQDSHQFLPRLLSLSLQKTAQQSRKRIGPPPQGGEADRRSIWNPSVIVEGKKLEKPSITAWTTAWPADDSMISGCEIEVYFSSLAFPVWIEVRSPHYKATMRAIDSGHHMTSPRPLVFQQSPLILGPGKLKKDHLELTIHCPTYYTSLKVLAIDLSEPQHRLVEICHSPTIESSSLTLELPLQTLESNFTAGHRYRWVLIPTAYPDLVIYSEQIFQW